MKKSIYIFTATALAALTLSGCIKETFPTDGSVTKAQVDASSISVEAMVNGLPSLMTTSYPIYGVSYQYEYDMAYPAIMIELSECLGDFYPLGSTDYDWYSPWNTCTRCGSSYAQTYMPWRTLYLFIKSANSVIDSIDLESEDITPSERQYAAIARTARAFYYYTLMVMYEPVDNIYTDCSAVLGYTVPIITESTGEDEAMSNPRASHEDMVEFILSDLETAEEQFTLAEIEDETGALSDSRLFPTLAAVYAIRAKTYMWDENWEYAAEAASAAIELSGAPMTEAQLTDATTGFNTATDGWIWYIHYDAENTSNLCNYIGWVSAESDWGYASLTNPGIDRSLYEKISDTDYRKHQFLDPDKLSYYAYESVRGSSFINKLPDYSSIKFRCVGGNYSDDTVGALADVPVIRVEEMYYILAEATGHASGAASGESILNSFMQSYRDPSYNFEASDADALALEVLNQMRVEFWGEGTAFATAKRLKPGVMQSYSGTNAPGDSFKINCEGIKPNWNFVIPDAEAQSNTSIVNNPDPTSPVATPCDEGVYGKPGSGAEEEGDEEE